MDRIHIDGIARTKNDIVESSVKEIFTATTFEDVLLKAHRVSIRIYQILNLIGEKNYRLDRDLKACTAFVTYQSMLTQAKVPKAQKMAWKSRLALKS